MCSMDLIGRLYEITSNRLQTMKPNQSRATEGSSRPVRSKPNLAAPKPPGRQARPQVCALHLHLSLLLQLSSGHPKLLNRPRRPLSLRSFAVRSLVISNTPALSQHSCDYENTDRSTYCHLPGAHTLTTVTLVQRWRAAIHSDIHALTVREYGTNTNASDLERWQPDRVS